MCGSRDPRRGKSFTRRDRTWPSWGCCADPSTATREKFRGRFSRRRQINAVEIVKAGYAAIHGHCIGGGVDYGLCPSPLRYPDAIFTSGRPASPSSRVARCSACPTLSNGWFRSCPFGRDFGAARPKWILTRVAKQGRLYREGKVAQRLPVVRHWPCGHQ